MYRIYIEEVKKPIKVVVTVLTLTHI